MMKITYRCDGKEYTVTSSDARIAMTSTVGQGRTTVSVTARCPLELLRAEDALEHPISESALIFANGYQSWTETKEFTGREGLNDLSRLPRRLVERFAFRAYGSQSFTPMHRGTLLGFDYGYIKGDAPLFIGSDNFRCAYLMIRFLRRENKVLLESDVSGKALEAGESFTVFDYTVSDRVEESLTAYFDRLTPRTRKKLFGYTSWYHHYQNISEKIIETAIDEADERFDLFQIDDGFEPFVGDWMECDRDKFPNGLEPIVEKIHSKGMMAGIWLAPFAAEHRSALFRNHPELIRKNAAGEPILAGCNWGGFSPLDLDSEEAVMYIRSVLRHYADMGFDFFKLDFLYAANLSQMRGKTRAETAEFAYGLLREELGEKMILGCGATLSNGYERFEYMRVGPDLSLKFDDSPIMRLFHPERISTKVTLCNTVFRSSSNQKAYGNDPDVFLLRDDNIGLSVQQRYAVMTVNALFGALMMTSDHPKRYHSTQAAMLERALALFYHGTVTGYAREKNTIIVQYRIGEGTHSFSYDMKKGVIINER